MPNPIPFRTILAVYTKARRMHLGLSPSRLAARLKIRADQVKAAEAGKRIAAKARAALVAFNELEAWDHG